MGDVIQFKKPKLSEKHRGNTMCKNGFHQWSVDNEKVFDIKKSKLVTAYFCKRCGAKKNLSK